MTILTVVNDAQDELGLPRSSAVVASTSLGDRQFFSLFKRLGNDLRKRLEWPQLNKDFMFALTSVGPYTGDTTDGTSSISNLSSTTGITSGMVISGDGWNGIGSAANFVNVLSVSGNTVATNLPASDDTTTSNYYFSQNTYALPADFDEAVQRTHWDRYNRWELQGPLTPQEWQLYRSGILAPFPRRRFRIKGLQTNKFTVDPPPASSEDGQYLAFEYQTKNWVRPPVWVASTTFAAGAYCFNNGNFYYTTNGGTTGSTEPTHISGSVSDGGVTWTYFNGDYVSNIDTDSAVSMIDEDIMTLGLRAYWRKAKGMEYADLAADLEKKISNYATSVKGSAIVNMGVNPTPNQFIGRYSIPETGYGA